MKTTLIGAPCCFFIKKKFFLEAASLSFYKIACALCANVFWSASAEGGSFRSVSSRLCRDFAMAGHCELFDDIDEDGQRRLHDGMMLVHEPLGTCFQGRQREILMEEELDLESANVSRVPAIKTTLVKASKNQEIRNGKKAVHEPHFLESKTAALRTQPVTFLSATPVYILKSKTRGLVTRCQRVSFSCDAAVAPGSMCSTPECLSDLEWVLC